MSAPTPSTYQDKIEALKRLVEEHNHGVSASAFKVDIDKVMVALEAHGGTSLEALRAATWEDLESCGLPRILARSAANIFRSDIIHPGEPGVLLSRDVVAHMPYEELFAAYDPSGERNSLVFDRLKELASGNRCVVFQDDGSVNVVASSEILRRMRRTGVLAPAFVYAGSKPYAVQFLGDAPIQILPLNPFFADKPLLADETCDVTGISWKDVDIGVRRLAFLAATRTNELDVSTPLKAREALKSLMSKERKPEAIVPQAALLLDEMRRFNELPSMAFTGRRQLAGKQDPF